MVLRKFRKDDLEQVASLIHRTYKKFNNNEFFEKEALQNYLNHYNLKVNSSENLLKNFKRSTIFYVFEENKKIIGMIRGTDTKIINLFVDAKQQRKGLGRKLVEKFEKEAIELGSSEIKIRASLYAVAFYQRMNYKKTTGLRNFRGLKIIPMKKVLYSHIFSSNS